VIHHSKTKEGMEAPLIEWTPAIAPASGVFYNADAFPAWKGNFLVGALGGLGRERRPGVYRLVLDGRTVVAQERLVPGYGRVREVAVGPDGFVYFSTSNKDGRGRAAKDDDRIMRIVPEKK
jgi:aldose sugar dehydrogenase